MTDEEPMTVLRKIMDMPAWKDGYKDAEVVAAVARDLPKIIAAKQRMADRIEMMASDIAGIVGSQAWPTMVRRLRDLAAPS